MTELDNGLDLLRREGEKLEPLISLLLLLLGLYLAIQGFHKEDRPVGVVGILIVLLTALQWGLGTQEWFKQQPRTISASVGIAMVEKLKEYSGQSVNFSYITDDTETFAFAQQIEAILKAAEWEIHTSRPVSTPAPIVDVQIRLIDKQPSEAALAFAHTLRNAGIAFTMGPSIKPPGKGEFWIVVGKKKQ